jgi:hypothetical protein
MKGIFDRQPKDNEVERLQSRRKISMKLFSDSIQSMDELLRMYKKLKHGATLEETDIDGA